MLKRIEEISEDVLRVSDLSNRPNYPLTYGGDGLSASALKARFDSLPLAVRDKVNEILRTLGESDAQSSGASYIGIAPQSYNEGQMTMTSLADLVAALEDTGIAQLLMVHTGERVCSLQACLQEYAQKLKETERIEWSLENGKLILFFPDGAFVELPYSSEPQVVPAGTLLLENHGRYLLQEQEDKVEITYPSFEVISEGAWSESLGRSGSVRLTFSDRYNASGLAMFGGVPYGGHLCVVTVNDGEEQTPVGAIANEDGSATLYLDEMDITIIPMLEGVRLKVNTHANAHVPGEELKIYVREYATFEADLRVCVPKNGLTVSFPPSLYSERRPDFTKQGVWEIHINGGVVEARRAVSAAEAIENDSAGVSHTLEVIANGAY